MSDASISGGAYRDATSARLPRDCHLSPTIEATTPDGPQPHGRRGAILGWTAVGLAVAATAAVSIAVLRPDGERRVDDNVRTVTEHGSISALDHRLAVERRRHTPVRQ